MEVKDSMTDPILKDRFEGCLLGLAIGDTLDPAVMGRLTEASRPGSMAERE
jgi:hypothetical protein